MKRLFPLVALVSVMSTAGIAQTTTPREPSPTTPPSTAPAPSETQPSSPDRSSPGTSTIAPSPDNGAVMTMTDDQVRSWIDKPVYSADDRNLGEVVEFRRDNSGKVLGMYADIGGFLGIGETRVLLRPEQFRLGADRVMLTLNSEEAKSLPKIAQ